MEQSLRVQVPPTTLFLRNFVMKKCFFLLLFSCLFIMFVYFHPTKESMICNKSYECKITHEYFGLIKYHHKQNINNKTVLFYKDIPLAYKHRTWHHLYLTYDNLAPFIYYWNHQSRLKDINYVFKIEQKRFNDYLINPQIKYEVYSEANTSFWTYILMLFVLSPYLIKLYLDNYFKNNRK